MTFLFALFLALQAPSSCQDVAGCRAEAEAAAARGDYEAFHDLAWRAMQKGKPNDPSLMLLLARAESLSGRFGDALVMLGRLADMHAPVDPTLPDFDRARGMPEWAALESRLTGKPAAPADANTPVPASPAPATPTVPPASPPPPATPAPPPSAEGLSFEAPVNLGAFALAHDSVSRRFVVGDAASRRLLVIDEVSTHVVPYVSAASAGFFDDLTGLTIDAREGDLWVVSANATASVLHKLQLVSGRALMTVRPAESLSPVRFVDVTVSPDGTVFALDAAGPRIFRLHPGSRTLEVALAIDAPNVTALTAVDEHVVYVASGRGLLRVDLAPRSVQPVKSVEDLGGFVSLAWRNGALVGVQRTGGASLVVRVALDGAGTRAQPRAILAAATFPIVGTLVGGTFYYLRDAGSIQHVAVR